jgi:hypothetical protein
MPFPALLRGHGPAGARAEVLAAADDLTFRDFLTVALVVPEDGFPDNWIYIHAPEVKTMRIQNFGSWSPYLVKDGRNVLGLEYTCSRATSGGRPPTRSSSRRAPAELERSAWWPAPTSRPATWCGCRRRTRSTTRPTRPTSTCCGLAREHAPNVHPVGRNGMHKYNNQDHSMYTAMLTVENISGRRPRHLGGQRRGGVPRGADASGGATPSSGTGRDAPVIPRSAYGEDHPLNRPS